MTTVAFLTRLRGEVVVAQQLCAGVDAGKTGHYCVVIDVDRQRLL
jgi:hypothetical protein